MQIDSTIRSGNKVTDDYIIQLEEEVKSFNAQNSKQLIRSIDLMASKISKDLDLLSREQTNDDGTEVELSGKFVDTFLKMVKDAPKIKEFSDLVNSMYEGKPNDIVEPEPEIVAVVEGKEIPLAKPVIKVGQNSFETVMKKVKEGVLNGS